MIDNRNIHEVIKLVKEEVKKFEQPYVGRLAKKGSPFKILVSTLLSSRTKDEVTEEASERLFKHVSTPEDLLAMKEDEIERLIYPVGFYKTKAKLLKKLAKVLVEKYGGSVPDSLEELVKLPGVGRKTANLVMILGFDKLGICVDTHVHRIVNRWGYVSTKTPEETEFELRKKLPKKYWKIINDLLVRFGKNVCKPVNPRCDECPLKNVCPKIGVNKS